MKVILNQDIANLGEEGAVKTVAPGYARNYLLPKGLVMPFSKGNLRILEKKREEIETRKEEKRKNALSLKEKLETEELVFSMPAGTSGKLFGSVNNGKIAEELDKKGYTIEKKQIDVPDHTIRNIGEYEIKIKLYEKQEAIIKVRVEATESDKSE